MFGLKVAAVALGVLLAPLPLGAQDGLTQARALFNRGHFDSALTLIRREADNRPNHAETQYWLGRIAADQLSRSGGISLVMNAARSRAGFSRAVQLEPNNLDYLEGLAAERVRRERPVEGTGLLAEFLVRGDARQNFRADSLVAALDRANPSDPNALRVVAEHWNRRDRPAQALAASERLAARQPDDYVPHAMVGRNLVLLRREPRRAQAHLRQAIGRWGPQVRWSGGYPLEALWWRLGQTYVQLGNADSARVCYEEALRINSGFEQARRSLDSLVRR
jgi:tetratricopeptide (TPR) repeat protein